VACASTGNHGQGMALAGQLFGCTAVIVAPVGTNERKLDAMRRLGADLRIQGANFAEAAAIAARFAVEENLTYVEDGESPDVMAGCATLTLEVVEQLPDLQHLIVPVGGGNLVAACALVMQAVRPDVILTGVQSEAAPRSV
jgi:threonine dehydratase